MFRSDFALSPARSSRNLFSGYNIFNNRARETLRTKLIDSYAINIAEQTFEPTKITADKFLSAMHKWLQYSNIPYSKKQNEGLFYAEDYVKNYASGEESTDIHGLTNPKFWDISTQKLFRANKGHLPNQVLNAFFMGPTFAECGSVLQACIYRAIEEMIGTNVFNRIFGSSLTNFLITPFLYNKIYTKEEKPEYSIDFRTMAGNPLYFLFDNIISENITEKDIKEGDIVYIKGVEKYADKHLIGSGSGWNVICTGRNANNENLYLGFGPESFPKPLTYKEIQSILIKYYNADQSIDTKKRIAQFKSLDNFSLESIRNQSQALLAYALTNDKVQENHPIVGLECAMRLNKEKLEYFIHQGLNDWHTNSLEPMDEDEQSNAMESSIKQITTFSVESRGKSFKDYEVTNPAQNEMLSVAKKFASAVCSNSDTPIGLIMTGMPGIGKTHLSIAVADYAARHGLKVIFVDEKTIENLYQQMSEQRHSLVPDSVMNSIFDNWLKGADLIVLDDINSKYGTGASFLKKAIRYSMQNNKAIMISGNKPILSIHENLPDYVGYDDKRRNNFLIVQNIQGMSYRKNWWSSSEVFSTSGALTTNQDAIEILANLNGSQAAGIVLEENNADFDKISQRYLELSPDKNIKIRILQEPYRNNHIFDYYVHDVSQHDVFLIKANHSSESEQLLDLISHIHDLGKKIIVVTENETKLNRKIDEAITYSFKDTQQRLKDRVRNILLKKSDWQQVKPSILPKTKYPSSPVNHPNITLGPPQVKDNSPMKMGRLHIPKTEETSSLPSYLEPVSDSKDLSEFERLFHEFSKIQNLHPSKRRATVDPINFKDSLFHQKGLFVKNNANTDVNDKMDLPENNACDQSKETYCGFKSGFMKKRSI